MVLPQGYLISAVATEHMALLLGILMAYEAQTGRCVIAPEWEVGEDAKPTEEEHEASRAAWKGQIVVHADCMAVIQATSRVGASLRDQFKFGGCYKHEGCDAKRRVVKVDAHKGKEQAAKEGWGHHWKGNNAADGQAGSSETGRQ